MKLRLLGAAAAAIVAVNLAAPAEADPLYVTISAPDIDVTTNACHETPVQVTLHNSSQSTLYQIDITNPLGTTVAHQPGAYASPQALAFNVCGSIMPGIYTVTVNYSSDDTPVQSMSQNFTVFRPRLDVVSVNAGVDARHSRSLRDKRVTARLAIHASPMVGRRVLVTSNGHRSYKTTDAAGRVRSVCKRGHRCRIVFGYDGFVSSKVITVGRRHHVHHHHGH